MYFAQLVDYATKKTHCNPVFSFVDGSKKPSRIKGKQWNDTMVEMPVDVNEDDMKLFQSPLTTPNELQEHLACTTANAKGKTEVNIRNLTTEE